MQKKDLEERILYVGLDDSNHVGKRTSEIVVAAFSFQYEDGVVKNYGKRAKIEKVHEWLNDQNRDYRFAILIEEKFKHTNTNLPYTANGLVKSFLNDYNQKIGKIYLYFDGELSQNQRDNLKLNFSFLSEFKFDNFTKQNRYHKCPKVVYIADALASSLYHKEFSYIFEHEKRVIIK